MATSGQPTRGFLQQPGRRWWLPAARPQGAASRPGLPPARATAGRSDRQQGQRPREAAPPARRQQRLSQGRLPTPTACSTTTCAGRRRQCRWGQGEG
ncbi:hypothetical protein BHE74_00040199 [Ensete ventricosum]|nr:hypothetical protein BHE74_00040199 [Ensete ventricosum]